MKRLDLKNPKDRIKFILLCTALFGPLIVICILDPNALNEMIHETLDKLGVILFGVIIGAICGLSALVKESEKRRREKIRMERKMEMYNELKEELREEIREELRDHYSNR